MRLKKMSLWHKGQFLKNICHFKLKYVRHNLNFAKLKIFALKRIKVNKHFYQFQKITVLITLFYEINLNLVILSIRHHNFS